MLGQGKRGLILLTATSAVPQECLPVSLARAAQFGAPLEVFPSLVADLNLRDLWVVGTPFNMTYPATYLPEGLCGF